MNELDDDIKSHHYFLKCLKSKSIPIELYQFGKAFIDSQAFKQEINIKTLTNKEDCIYHISKFQ